MFCMIPTRSRLVHACLACCTLLILTLEPVNGVAAVATCPVAPPSLNIGIFQKPIDATLHFDLQIVAMKSPANNNLSLLYRAVRNGKVLAFNPTLLVAVGGTIDFTLQNCLSKSDIKGLQQFIQQDAASTAPSLPGSFQIDQAPQMMPSGYINIHSHGLGGRPLAATQGHPDTPAGDEVLTTFISPIGSPSTEPGVFNAQHYNITVPLPQDGSPPQDAGLYWYHPHLHGEAQQEVFLGLTGAIVVLPKGADLETGKSLSNLFVIRDFPFPVSPFNFSLPGSAGRALPKKHPAIQTRDLFFAGISSIQKTATASATPIAGPNPRCSLFGVPSNSPLCLPDNVTGPSPTPQLTTLVSVNGVATDIPDTNDPNTVKRLSYSPVKTTTSFPLRVLNASSNTYLKLALVGGLAPNSIDLTSPTFYPTPTAPLLHLKVSSRDGHPIPAGAPQETDYILLPPGSRAEFMPTNATRGSVSLVSQYVNTGAAGDLVPFRILAIINTTSTPPRRGLQISSAAKAPLASPSLRYESVFHSKQTATTHRAFAFFEQARGCPTTTENCGQSFYLIDITSSVYGIGGGRPRPVSEAKPFSMPMHSDGTPDRDPGAMFDANGVFNAALPSVEVALHKQLQINEEWDIYNFTAEDHAFHIHQLGFGVLESCSPSYLSSKSLSPDCVQMSGNAGDENAEANLLLDVINVSPALSLPNSPGAPATIYPGKVSLRVPFTQDIAGNFVLHCHLLEHEDNGMMLGIQVWPDDIPSQSTPILEPSIQHQPHPGMTMP